MKSTSFSALDEFIKIKKNLAKSYEKDDSSNILLRDVQRDIEKLEEIKELLEKDYPKNFGDYQAYLKWLLKK